MAFGVWHSLRVIYISVVFFIFFFAPSKLYCDHIVYVYILLEINWKKRIKVFACNVSIALTQ